MNDNLQSIVDGCVKGKAKYQRQLYDMLSPMVMGVCVRYADNREDAEDMFQDGFIRIFEKVNTLKDCSRLYAWAYQLVVNLCIDFYRKKSKMEVVGEVVDEEGTAAFDVFTVEEIVAAAKCLPTMQRIVFNLCIMEQYSIDEVASRLGCSNGAVRVNLSRAKNRLQNALK